MLLIFVGAAALYLIWVFGSRWSANQEWERRNQASHAPVYTPYPGTEGVTSVKILQFYAAPDSLDAGERSSLCYGVYKAKSVRIEPAVEPIEPSLNRCIEVAPKRTTTYTLTAVGDDGKTISASVKVKVGR
jgi:hypothetical protein